MNSDAPYFTAFTLVLGSLGIAANLLLMWAIVFRTPAHMRVYSRILAASAVCDLVGVIAMMISGTRQAFLPNSSAFLGQQIFKYACMLEFGGVCTRFGVDACCAAFGVQAHIYGSTSLLLALSFAYRLSALDDAAAHKRRERAIFFIIIGIVIIQAPLVPLFHLALTRADPALELYRANRGFGQEKVIGVVQFTDPYTIIVSNYSMMYSLVPFVASIVMRRKIIRKVERMQGSMSTSTKAQHEMLVNALNLQLLVSSCYFLGCDVFGFNLVMVNAFPSFPETSPLAVPICNMQNVITAITNLYVIKPYRQSLMCRTRKQTAVHALHSQTDIASRSVSEVVGVVQVLP